MAIRSDADNLRLKPMAFSFFLLLVNRLYRVRLATGLSFVAILAAVRS